MVGLVNNLFVVLLVVIGMHLAGAFVLVGYIIGFRTCQKSYKEPMSSIEDQFDYKRKEITEKNIEIT